MSADDFASKNRNDLLEEIRSLRSQLGELKNALHSGNGHDLHSQQHLAAIVDSSDDAIISQTLSGTILTWNGGAERIYGYTAAEMVGKCIEELWPADRHGEQAELTRRLLDGGRVDHYETVQVCKDGRQIDASMTMSPIRNAHGEIVGASMVARDITDRKRAEEERAQLLLREQRARAEAEAANRRKEQFLAVLSHELRTPLTPVLARVMLMMRRPGLPPELESGLEMIRRNVELEARLIDDLLDATTFSREKLKLDFRTVDAHEKIRAALEIYEKEINAKGLRVAVDLRAQQHHVRADPSRLQQVFWNLISNAVKYTPEKGSIWVRSWSDEQGTLHVQVKDSGVGIEPEMMKRIFDPFEQGEQTLTRRFGGLGLGLCISRALMERHGGTLTAASDGHGKGATFDIELKTVVAPSMAASPKPPAPTKRAMTILLVEDNEDTLRVMSRLLQLCGYNVKTATSVQGALEEAHGDFDLLISDIGLPDGTGWDLMRQLTEKRCVKGIALSGFVQEEDIQRSKAAGFMTHLAKPIVPDVLEAAIQQVVVA